MTVVSRGFRGRRAADVNPARVPPGQYVTRDFPVLSAGPTPHTALQLWDFSIIGELDQPRGWTWEQFRALPSEEITRDIHCVTKWSKLDTVWRGVAVDTLLEGIETSAEYVTAYSDGGYTTNLPLEDVTGGKGWVVFAYEGQPLAPEHGGRPRTHARSAPLLLEERQVGERPPAPIDRRARLLGDKRLPQLRRPMAGTALLGRLTWQLAELVEVVAETPRVKTIVFDVPGWPGHRAGQHVDVRLTAEDGYQAERSYSIASASDGTRVALTVQRLEDGEVSPYLTDELRPGDKIELRGPIGGYFVWEPSEGGPLMLVAGGSGIVPLMAMIRTRAAADDDTETRLLYSSRSQDDVIYRDELERLSGNGLTVVHTLTDSQPPGWTSYARRVDAGMLAEVTPAPAERPRFYVCGPTPFVEAVAESLVQLGHDPRAIKTERFGPTGG
jgi:ferredoxin-NADP reductase